MRHQGAEQLPARDERDRHACAASSAAQLAAELAQTELLRGVCTLRRRPAQEHPFTVLLREVEVRGEGAEQVEGTTNGKRTQFVQRLGGGDFLAELGQMLELEHALAHLLVEPGVLDRAGDQRRARREEVRFALRELPRSLRVKADDADRVPTAAEQRHRHERLEPLLLEFWHVVEARVVECALADERRLAPFERPPRQALAALQADPAGQVLVGL